MHSILLSLRIALSSLAAHKLRAVLAMLGVFLGALALTGVHHFSLGMTMKTEMEIEKLGPNLFMAVSGRMRMRREGSVSVGDASRNFTWSDARALVGGMPQALRGAPYVSSTMSARYRTVKVPAQVVASTPDYSRVRNISPENGRFITEADLNNRAMVCVLGRTVARKLFGKPEAALGKRVFFYRAGCEVIGVLPELGSDIVGTDQDEQVFIPLSTYLRRFSNQDWISGVYIQLQKQGDPEIAKRTAAEILRKRHLISPGQKDDFEVLTARDTIKLQEEALNLVKVLGLISSSVSFAVGGMGILSIMILLVRARRLEIGVRRATGARRIDIVRQFLFEAGLMSGTGGALGVALGLIIIVAVDKIAEFPVVFAPLTLIGVLVGSIALGVAAGAYPAGQAARYEILDILRSPE